MNNIEMSTYMLSAETWHEHYSSILEGKVEGIRKVYRTQKAGGLVVGWIVSAAAAFGYRVPYIHGVWPHIDRNTLATLIADGGRVKFARPAPLKPRHGFVESRNITNVEELDKVISETIAVEPEGEVIIMDRLSGKYSAIMAANGVTWGRGNDGVTGGGRDLRHIPCPPGTFDDYLLPHLGVLPADFPKTGVYVELVEDNGQVCVVQVRLGPKQPSEQTNRVVVNVEGVKINNIIRPETDDLIIWDKVLSAGEDKAGTLVWLPKQALSGHFAVQAIANGYNVSVEKTCPAKIGAVLSPSKTAVKPWSDQDYGYLARCFRRERGVVFWDFPRDIVLSVGTLHALPYWSGEGHLMRLVARGVVTAIRYGLAACLGESRHRLRPPFSEVRPPQVPWNQLLREDLNGRSPGRGYVFVRSLAMPWAVLHRLALDAAADLYISNHPKAADLIKEGKSTSNYKSGFMGVRWEWAALKVAALVAAVDKFVENPCVGNWQPILGLYNEVINAAHNGGTLMNKWVSPNIINNAATRPALVFGLRQAMKLVWEEGVDKPLLCWLPLSLADMEAIKETHVQVGGHYFPKEIEVDKFMDDGVFHWKSLGKACLAAGKIAYVEDRIVDLLPEVSLDKNLFTKAMKLVLTPPKPKFEPISEEPEDEEESDPDPTESNG